ncbi:hypothetical protein D3C87_952560 [compost metagenome]
MSLLRKYDENKPALMQIGRDAIRERVRLGLELSAKDVGYIVEEKVMLNAGDDEWDMFLEQLEISKVPVKGRDIVVDGKYARVTLECNIVHNHAVITYSLLVGTKVINQFTDYANALEEFNAL